MKKGPTKRRIQSPKNLSTKAGPLLFENPNKIFIYPKRLSTFNNPNNKQMALTSLITWELLQGVEAKISQTREIGLIELTKPLPLNIKSP